MRRFRASALVAVLVVVMSATAYAEFKCTETGSFLDVTSNCTAYYNCIMNVFQPGKFIKSKFHCDYGMLFSKEEERCLTASNLMCRKMDDGTTESVPIATTPTLPGTTATLPTEAHTTVTEPATSEITEPQTTVTDEPQTTTEVPTTSANTDATEIVTTQEPTTTEEVTTTDATTVTNGMIFQDKLLAN